MERDSYDSAGNRIAVETPGGKVVAAYDDRDRLQSWGTARYTFRAVALSDGRKVEYLVDAAGTRVGKKVDGALVAGYLHGPHDRLVA